VRASYVCVFLYLTAALAVGQNNARTTTDFKNFSYPWSRYAGWPHELQWLDTSVRGRVRLADGKWPDGSEDDAESSPQFTGLTLENVQFADVTGDGKQEALVTLRYDTGGTQYSHYVYIYSLGGGSPRLLAYFHSGDRSYWGLYQVYGRCGKLVVELFDPKKETGDCCSNGFVRTVYQWRGGRFQQVGAKQSGTPQAPSRIPVTVFGTHN
jgi:hypothetical protein